MFKCTKCGKQFVGHRNWNVKEYYCSSECQYADKIKIKCEWCGNDFEIQRYLKGIKKYCSSSCRNKAYWQRRKNRAKNSLDLKHFVYIAAFIDGEGTISVRRERKKEYIGGYRYYSVVEMNNTDVGVMQYLRKCIGPARYYIAKPQMENRKTCYRFTLPTKTQEWLLPRIHPFLQIKKRQCELVMEFIKLLGKKKYAERDMNLKKRIALYQEIHALNHRGINKRCTF